MDRSTVQAPFALKPVVAAVALAASAAWAAPTPNQMPGGGIVTAVSLGSGILVGAPIINLANGATGIVDGKVVITWGGPTAPPGEVTNPLGFNLGANATINFTSSVAGGAVLNIDASGNPSQIYGNLLATNTSGFYPAIFVANTNGIVVGPGGRIVAPAGVGLFGTDLNNPASINDFIGNNGWVFPLAPSYGASVISFGAIPSTGNVSIAGAINGDLVLNKPAPYILVAGNNVDVLNTGNLFGREVFINAGLAPQAGFANLNGLSNQTVNRLYNVDTASFISCCNVGPNPTNMQVLTAGHVVNEGSISQDFIGYIVLGAGGSVRSGIAGSTDTQVGLFADDRIYLDAYSNDGVVEVYNVVSGYTTNQIVRFLRVNTFSAVASTPAFRPDVIIDALTPGAQASSIANQEEVTIYGGNVDILSTINHRSNASGGVQGDFSLVINGSESVDIAADVGAGHHVVVNSNGPLTVSGNVQSDTDGVAGGGIYLMNDAAGAPTTISGNLRVPAPWGSWIYVRTFGPLTISGNLGNASGFVDIHNEGTGAGNFTDISGNIVSGNGIHIANYLSAAPNPLTISGNLISGPSIVIDNYGTAPGNTTTISGSVTSTGGDVYVNHFGPPTGMLTVSGSLNAFYDVTVFSAGHAQLGGVGIFAGDDIFATVQGTSLMVDGPWTAGDYLNITSPLALAKLNPAGVLTAPTIAFAGLSFTGVNSSWLPYVDASEKPAAQLVSNSVNALLLGSMNAPIAGNTNWPLNSMDIAPLFTLAPVNVSVSAVGGGFQAVNLRVLGDAIVDSGVTTTPFIGVPLTTGGLPAGGIQGNLGSQLILAADGAMTVMGMPTLSLFGPLIAFQWPGGASFIAGTTLQTFTPIYNAWSVSSPPYGGVFFDAPYIALGSYIATSGTAW
ncbi:MAG: hypothetical protein IT517_16355, partial [Burkholderiales bacterium]|nr:hypothetical protein [Burkholderiales bacterium]